MIGLLENLVLTKVQERRRTGRAIHLINPFIGLPPKKKKSVGGEDPVVFFFCFFFQSWEMLF